MVHVLLNMAIDTQMHGTRNTKTVDSMFIPDEKPLYNKAQSLGIDDMGFTNYSDFMLVSLE